MKDTIVLITESYSLACSSGVVSHPLKRAYPDWIPTYLVPAKKNGLMQYLFQVNKVIDAVPEQLDQHLNGLSKEQQETLLSYRRVIDITRGFKYKDTVYRFYLMKAVKQITEPVPMRGIWNFKDISSDDLVLGDLPEQADQ